MPITVDEINALTDEQITPEIEAALFPKIEARATAYLTGKGHIVKPKTEYDTEFANELEKKKKEFADSEAPRFYGAMDKMLEAVGYKKPDGMSTASYVEKLSNEGKLPFTAAQLEKLEKMLKGEGGSSTAEELIRQAKKDLDDYKDTVKKEKEGDFAKQVKRVVDSSLKAAPVPVNPNLKTDAEKASAKKADIETITATFNTVYEAAEDKDGVLFFKKKGTDTPLMNATTGEPMTPLEIIQKNHSIFLAPQNHQQKGGGTGGGGGAGGGGAKSLADIFTAASEAGHKTNSPAWKTFVNDEKQKAGLV
ncbi:hypothetical protein [Spirosoma foliorum]|uniref:Uncharacterized protein n=1 Tax=Spirosoma foliorum TaxID=2710596 RepID=A0A7G5H5I6_9BACT|nr:hypothetical protein [Spirosoma foliorum]QMW06378.1 hypothetical protein H3H32_16545 [Spirosoma foliorum]